jgi:hypothetical protein
MQHQEENLRNQIALGWVMNGVVLALAFAFLIIESSVMSNDFRSIRIDPGTTTQWLVYIVALYPLMPIYIYFAHERRWRIFRWVAVAVACLAFVFFLLHHLSHWNLGQRLGVSSHVFDVAIEIVSVWVIVQSVRWAKIRRPDAA